MANKPDKQGATGISPEFDALAELENANIRALRETLTSLKSLAPDIGEEQILNAIEPLQQRINTLSDMFDDAMKQALTDPLTGIPNRRYFEKELQRTLEKSKHLQFNLASAGDVASTAPTKKAIVFIDIVGLSLINKMGQVAGDDAIAAVANRLQEILRKGELGARVGGDEFAYLASDDTNNPDFISGLQNRFQEGVNGVTFEYNGTEHPLKIYIAAFEIDFALNAKQNMTIAGEKLAAAKVAAGVARQIPDNNINQPK